MVCMQDEAWLGGARALSECEVIVMVSDRIAIHVCS